MNFEAKVITGKSGKQSMLLRMDDLYPECRTLTKGTHLSRLSCWTDPNSCHRGSYMTCMSTLVKRAFQIFQGMPRLEIIIVHWDAPHKDGPNNLRKWGLIIERDDSKEMRISPLNKWGHKYIDKSIGKKYHIDFG